MLSVIHSLLQLRNVNLPLVGDAGYSRLCHPLSSAGQKRDPPKDSYRVAENLIRRPVLSYSTLSLEAGLDRKWGEGLNGYGRQAGEKEQVCSDMDASELAILGHL